VKYLRAWAITFRAVAAWMLGNIGETEARRRVREARVMTGKDTP
jgi:hypothetical protein